MKEMFLTKEGTLTETVKKVYLSDDNTYYHTNSCVVTIYNKLKIKNVDKIFPEEININGYIFNYPSIDCSDLSVTYTAKDDGDIYANFYFDKNLTYENFKTIKPSFEIFDIGSEIFEDLDENDLQYHLKY